MANKSNSSPPHPDFKPLSKSIKDAYPLKRQPLRVLVLGPCFDDDSLGSALRSHIVDQCRQQQVDVVLAEHSELRQYFANFYDPIGDLCKMEWTLATQQDNNTGYDLIDAIVILPDSAGSLVELGMFVCENSIHTKILVLFNSKHEATFGTSFIGQGAKVALDNGRAMTTIMDYSDLPNSWTAVRRFPQIRRSFRMWEIQRKRILRNVPSQSSP